MKDTRIIMGMPISIEIVDSIGSEDAIEKTFAYFVSVDERFSTYKHDSEIMRINRGEIGGPEYTTQTRQVFALAEQTKKETHNYFDIKKPDGSLDPSGIVKGWAIQQAAVQLSDKGYANFYIDVGGDIQSQGVNASGETWSVGIRNPFNLPEIVKVIYPRGLGVATSGTYIRGQHIYNPHALGEKLTDIVSLTVIGPNILEADRYATGAFAMGRDGVYFIETLSGFEAYAIDSDGIATMTTGFEMYTKK